jgi:hypothetical protein
MCNCNETCNCKESRYDAKFKEKYLKLYQENLKLKEAIKAIEKKTGIHCKI